MAKDILFSEKRGDISDFDFGKDTAVVFDDMLERSVPFYTEVQRMMGEIAGDYAVDGSRLYDLGCSTANALLHMDRLLPSGVRYVGIDFSNEMLDRAREKIKQRDIKRDTSSFAGI